VKEFTVHAIGPVADPRYGSQKGERLWRVGSTAVDNGMESEVIDNSIKG
jgi:hypothetical protein